MLDGKFSGTLILVSLENGDMTQYNFDKDVMKEVVKPKQKSSIGKSASSLDCIITYRCTYWAWCTETYEYVITYTVGTSCYAPTWNPCIYSSLDYGFWNAGATEEIGRICFPSDPYPFDPPPPPGGGGDPSPTINLEDPGAENYELEGNKDAINLMSKLGCFDNIPTNFSTTYSVKICADIPVNSNPNSVLGPSSTFPFVAPGHVFIELTKTTGASSVTQTFGFYPEKLNIATLTGTVPSVISNDEYVDYDASLIKMLNWQEFDVVRSAAIAAAGNNYNLGSYNCVDFALDVFNITGSTLVIPNTVGSIYGTDYGKTPNGVYQDIKNKYTNLYPGASPFSGTGAASNCN